MKRNTNDQTAIHLKYFNGRKQRKKKKNESNNYGKQIAFPSVWLTRLQTPNYLLPIQPKFKKKKNTVLSRC